MHLGHDFSACPNGSYRPFDSAQLAAILHTPLQLPLPGSIRMGTCELTKPRTPDRTVHALLV